MRMRFKPYAAPELAACPFHVNHPTEEKGKWASLFAKQQPIHLELGCGKGGFLSQLALRNPQTNYIGIDLTDKVLILTKRNICTLYEQSNRPIDNVKILTYDIERIANMLDNSDIIDRIYINFCNPWNRKSGQKKHRLTHTKQLLLYREFLQENGEIYFKCDDDDLYEDTLTYLPQAGFEIIWQTKDLHAQEPEWNIRTEHEHMFSTQGIPIKALIAKKACIPSQTMV